jgi:hypothetical protein
MRRSVQSSALLLCVALVAGCGWRRALSFESPRGGERVEIYQPAADPTLGLRIDLVKGNRRSTILDAGETYIGFAYVHWSKTGSTVGILLCGPREVKLGYDTRTGRTVPFDQIRDELNADFKSSYGTDPNNYEPSQCIGSYYQDRFQRRFPIPH